MRGPGFRQTEEHGPELGTNQTLEEEDAECLSSESQLSLSFPHSSLTLVTYALVITYQCLLCLSVISLRFGL